MACTGIGSTLVFSGGISFTARWRSIGGLRESVEDLEDTHLGTTDYYEYCPDDLKEADPMDFEFYWDDTAPEVPPTGVLGTATIVIPGAAPSSSNDTTISGSCYIREFTTPPLAAGERKIATGQIKFDGKTGPSIMIGS